VAATLAVALVGLAVIAAVLGLVALANPIP
jgi:hypothetical protein